MTIARIARTGNHRVSRSSGIIEDAVSIAVPGNHRVSTYARSPLHHPNHSVSRRRARQTACEGLLVLNTASLSTAVPVVASFGISKSFRPFVTVLNDVLANTLLTAFPVSLPMLN